MADRIPSPLKWHGGKSYLAARIVAMMPPHIHYVEPYAGGLSVLLAKNPEGVSEVVNDIYGWLANFWRAMSHEQVFDAFRRKAEGTEFGESAWAWAEGVFDEWKHTKWTHAAPSQTAALAFFIRCRQSLAGRMDAFAPLSRTRTRGGMNEQASAWLTAVEGLPAVHARLKRVVVLNRDALDVIRQQDGPDTLFYLDPPYLHETRATTGEYAHEMTAGGHADLLKQLQGVKGKFLLSGYRSDLYDAAASHCGWKRHEFDLPNNASGAKSKGRKTECVWANFAEAARA